MHWSVIVGPAMLTFVLGFLLGFATAVKMSVQ